MSKKIPHICNCNLWQNPVSNEIKTQAFCQQFEQQQDFNCCRKLYKNANICKKYNLSKENFRKNYTPNNRVRVTTTVTRNFPSKNFYFNANSLHKDAPNLSCGKWETYQNIKKETHHCYHQQDDLYTYSKYSTKEINLPKPYGHQCQPYYHNNYLYRHHQNLFDRSNTRKFSNTIAHSTRNLCCSHYHPCQQYVVDDVPLNKDKNYCLLQCMSNKLQLNDVNQNILYSTQLSKYYDSQLRRLSQVSQQQEHLLGMFEMLPPLFLLKAAIPPYVASMATMQAVRLGKINNSRNISLFESLKQQQYPFVCANSIVQSTNNSLPRTRLTNFDLDYDKILNYVQTKFEPSDRDVIFGNSRLILSKCYGWEKSRIEWLLQMEEEHTIPTKRSSQPK